MILMITAPPMVSDSPLSRVIAGVPRCVLPAGGSFSFSFRLNGEILSDLHPSCGKHVMRKDEAHSLSQNYAWASSSKGQKSCRPVARVATQIMAKPRIGISSLRKRGLRQTVSHVVKEEPERRRWVNGSSRSEAT